MHTSSPLRIVDTETLDKINRSIADKRLRDGLGRTISQPFESGLLNREGTVFYPIVRGVIQMMRDELIELHPTGSDKQ